MKKNFFYTSIILFFLIIIISFFLFLIINQKTNKKDIKIEGKNYPIIINDYTGDKIIIEKEPTRIISFSPLVTEIISKLDEDKKLVGRTIYCDFPEKIKSITEIGDLFNYNLELIIKIKPDIIISSDFIDNNLKKHLNQFNIKLVTTYNPKNFKDTYKNIKLIGKILNKEKKAEKLINNINYKLLNIELLNKKIKYIPKICYIIDFKNGNFVATGDTYINELIERAGGENIAKNGKKWTYSLENIFKKNPDIIILDKQAGTLEELKNTSAYSKLNAIKKNKIYLINSDLINRNGPRLIEGLYSLFKIFHPEIKI